MTQKEAVYQAVLNVTGYNGDSGPCVPSKEQRAQINAILVEGFKAGSITLETTFDESDLKGYVSGLTSNWLRKDKRLNGGTSYIAKNPGSRAGSSDPSLKAMRGLMSTLSDPSEIAEVQKHIDARHKEIQFSKQAAVVIDYSVLPADLAAKFKK
jgi:hypothetical protein